MNNSYWKHLPQIFIIESVKIYIIIQLGPKFLLAIVKLKFTVTEIMISYSFLNCKSDARNKIIQQLESLPLTSRLEHIASDSKYTVNLYPTNWSHEADISTFNEA